MRITTQMLNETARKAGLPINQTSLLNYVNGSSNGSEGTLLNALNQKSSKTSASSKLFQKDTYEKLEKSANELVKAAETLAAEGEDSIFAKAEESGSNEIIYESIEKLVKNYNAAAKNLKSASGSLNNYYYQMLTEAAADDSDALNAIGVTFSKDGTLSLDKDKLKASSAEDVEKAVHASGTFIAKAAFIAERAADNAKTNAQSAASQYNSKGSMCSSEWNQYNFWG